MGRCSLEARTMTRFLITLSHHTHLLLGLPWCSRCLLAGNTSTTLRCHPGYSFSVCALATVAQALDLASMRQRLTAWRASPPPSVYERHQRATNPAHLLAQPQPGSSIPQAPHLGTPPPIPATHQPASQPLHGQTCQTKLRSKATPPWAPLLTCPQTRFPPGQAFLTLCPFPPGLRVPSPKHRRPFRADSPLR